MNEKENTEIETERMVCEEFSTTENWIRERCASLRRPLALFGGLALANPDLGASSLSSDGVRASGSEPRLVPPRCSGARICGDPEPLPPTALSCPPRRPRILPRCR